MGRKAGQTVRCTCTKCGAVEIHRGCTSGFECVTCRPNQRRNSLQYQAHKAVAAAVKRGALRPAKQFPCADCGKPAIEYDHRDYDKPLQVDPVYRSCNLRRGPALFALQEVAKVSG